MPSPLSSQSFSHSAENIPLSLGRSAASRYLDSLVLALLVAVSWIAMHRYQGIWHDGVLYAGQAIFRLDSVPFAKDLFFAYGSQDRFTAFPAIYALAIDNLGLPLASMLLLGMAHVAWVAAAAFLLREILSGLAFWQALILLAVLPASYGSMGIFSYGETFLTARIWAEPPALLAVACILRGYRIMAILSLVFAAAMHPVIAFPAVLFVFFFGFQGRHQLVAIAFGFAGLAILNALEIPPFAYLTKAMDPLWLRLSTGRSPFVFLDHWTVDEYLEPSFLALLLATAAVVSVRGNRRLWWSALGVFIVGMGLALMVVYWPGTLLIQMQPWRVLWLTKILAIAAGMSLLKDMWTVSPYNRLLLGALAVCAFTLDPTRLVCAVLLSALIIARHRFSIEPRLPSWLSRLAWAAILLVAGEKIFWAIWLSWFPIDFNFPSLSNRALVYRVFLVCQETGWFVFPLALFGSWWLLQRRCSSGGRVVLLLVASVSLLFFATHWQRTSRYQAAEDELRQIGHAELVHIIQPPHLTYWGSGLENLWFVLHRGSYASTLQAAGVIFSRQTALEADRRLARLRVLGLPDSRLDWLSKTGGESREVAPSIDGIVHLCHDPILDFVVLSKPVAGVSPMKTGRLASSYGEFYIYACESLRAFPDTSFSGS